MNETIELILSHRSIRKFEDRELNQDQIQTIVKCAQAASTSSFIQAYSIIGIKDRQKKKQLAALAGDQQYVLDNGHFFVFCGDLHRHELISEMHDVNLNETLENTETFMVAVIDATLAAQNAVLAAESMGLGACYIGGIRNNLEEVCKLLNIPKRVIPLFGICIGYPAQAPDVKPRLPMEHLYHKDQYSANKDLYKEQLMDYDKIISDYYNKRTNGRRQDTWTQQIIHTLKTPRRAYMKQFVEQQRFLLK